MLSEMGDFAVQSESSAAEWADSRETAFTEELDNNLRAHRYGGRQGQGVKRTDDNTDSLPAPLLFRSLVAAAASSSPYFVPSGLVRVALRRRPVWGDPLSWWLRGEGQRTI